MFLHPVLKPRSLGCPPASGRVVVLDVAFAWGNDFHAVTRPYLRALGDRLALWIDHHDHPAWDRVAGDPAFLLVGKLQARACPQLIDESVVARTGDVDHIVAHADFDGCMAAAKFMRGGRAVYPEADEDARFADAPGQGYQCSARGLRLCRALDQAQATYAPPRYRSLAAALTQALADDDEPAALRDEIDTLGQTHAQRRVSLERLLGAAVSPAHGVLLLDVPPRTPTADKKFLLRALEERTCVAIVREGSWLTCATFDDAADGLDLASLGAGLRGQRGYAWGRASLPDVLPALCRAVAVRRRGN